MPLLVKVPYFPNWTAAGASGPYEATPNLMVVVPDAHHVVLRYATTAVDWAGWTASGIGLVGLVGLGVVGRSPGSGPDPSAPAEGADPAIGGPTSDERQPEGASFELWDAGREAP